MASKGLIEGIKILRERTGAGMMDCKKALEENGLDIDKAADWLREKGIAKAAKKADRIAAEGLTVVKSCCKCGSTVVVLEINCETDFVAKSDAFVTLVDEVASLILEKRPQSLEEAKELTTPLFTDATVKMGEKLDLRRFELVTKSSGEALGTYIHMGGKISVAVKVNSEDKDLADKLAMHVAANSPLYISKEDIPAEIREKEMAIQLEAAKTDPKLAGKPANILTKILEGKVNKMLFESVLSEQTYLLDDSKTVGQLLLEKGVKVLQIIRYQIGEGIEKRKDDFASEVMNQAK